MNDEWFREILCCPQCGSDLDSDVALICRECGFYDETGSGLRLQQLRHYQLSFSTEQIPPLIDALNQIDVSYPALTYSGPNALRDSRQLMSELSHRIPQGGDALDLGCGPRDQIAPLSHLGFRYMGIDDLPPITIPKVKLEFVFN